MKQVSCSLGVAGLAKSSGALAIHPNSGESGYFGEISLLSLAVKFNLFGSFEDFVHVPFDRIGDVLLAIGCDFERPSNRAGAQVRRRADL